ncbi:hypothetical protein [Streptomyces sp. NBC_01014]|uniref:hypothetical protein n=1 Tax=Streptomyces sp. NBC_01014 TaxID=2903719 RepID=UPI00386EC2B6|nr:hypothetical protein OG282_34770 [Streptomyces sp. NBC_01014]
MRRAATVLGSLVMASSLALGLSGSAWAAQGTLTVSGKRYNNPGEGCYTGNSWPLSVNNNTDTDVFVFSDDRCQGEQVGIVYSGSREVFEAGESVYVPE